MYNGTTPLWLAPGTDRLGYRSFQRTLQIPTCLAASDWSYSALLIFRLSENNFFCALYEDWILQIKTARQSIHSSVLLMRNVSWSLIIFCIRLHPSATFKCDAVLILIFMDCWGVQKPLERGARRTKLPLIPMEGKVQINSYSHFNAFMLMWVQRERTVGRRERRLELTVCGTWEIPANSRKWLAIWPQTDSIASTRTAIQTANNCN